MTEQEQMLQEQLAEQAKAESTKQASVSSDGVLGTVADVLDTALDIAAGCGEGIVNGVGEVLGGVGEVLGAIFESLGD